MPPALPRLSDAQRATVLGWFPGAELVADHSWGLVDTAVLQVRHTGGDAVVKASPGGSHHLDREITAHEQMLAPLAGSVPRLLYAARGQSVLATEFVPGTLVLGTAAEGDLEVYRQAGALLARLHAQPARPDWGYQAAMDAKALAWLDGDSGIGVAETAALRRIVQAHRPDAVTLVPTHGDWQPRNWLVHEGHVRVIDFGRADWRPAESDLARLAVQQFVGRPDLETAFLDGYGQDPRKAASWPMMQVREAIGTAAWAHQVGDTAFEAQGKRMIAEVLTLW